MRARFLAASIAAAIVATSAGSIAPQGAGARVLEQLATTTGRPFAVHRPEVRGIANFAEIEPGLARGAEPTDEGLKELKARGFRTVIGLRSDPDEREKLARLGIEYIELPMHAGVFGAAVPTPEQIESFLDIASDSAKRPVFFHCKRGKDRTGAMAAIYRVERCGWRMTEAVEEMRAFGFHTYYRKLRRFVEGYSKSAARSAGSSLPRSG